MESWILIGIDHPISIFQQASTFMRTMSLPSRLLWLEVLLQAPKCTVITVCNTARRQSGFPTFISCQRQDANVLPERRQSHQGDKLCDVSTAPLVARWPVFLARGSDADGEPHWQQRFRAVIVSEFRSYSFLLCYSSLVFATFPVFRLIV